MFIERRRVWWRLDCILWTPLIVRNGNRTVVFQWQPLAFEITCMYCILVHTARSVARFAQDEWNVPLFMRSNVLVLVVCSSFQNGHWMCIRFDRAVNRNVGGRIRRNVIHMPMWNIPHSDVCIMCPVRLNFLSQSGDKGWTHFSIEKKTNGNVNGMPFACDCFIFRP